MNKMLCTAGKTAMILGACFFLFVGCQQQAKQAKEATPTQNTLTDDEKAAGWTLLFDGKTTNGWHVYNQQGVSGWDVKDGELIALGKDGGGKDIVTDQEFDNFELSLEWKISPAGNSGIFFNVLEDTAYGAVYETGPEYQLIDDVGFPEKLEDWQKSAANYAMHPPATIATKPVGEFNVSRLIVNKGHVEHWLNDQKIVEYELWTPEWEALVKTGKWKDYPGYGIAKKGHIALQDHGNQIWFRNIKVRKL